MKRCLKCGRKYDNSWNMCIHCDTSLSDEEDRLTQLEKQAEQILKEIKQIREGKSTTQKIQIQPEQKQPIVAEKKEITKKPAKENTETQIGRYLLNKIGVVSLVVGICFFIAYTLQYLIPVYKIAVSYLISAGLLFWGVKVEKNVKFEKYGRSLIAGGWSLIYFVTFATHHISAVKIVNSQIVDLVLMAVVGGAMIAHLLKYRSQTVIALVLFLGYFTAGISQVTYFTLVYITLLTIVAGVLAYKMRWYELPLFSMSATYATYFIWTRPQIRFSDVSGIVAWQKFLLLFGFLVVYWITYTVLSFIIKAREEKHENIVTSSIFLNAFCFGLLGGVAFQEFNPGLRFNFFIISAAAIAVLSLLLKLIKQQKYLFHPYLIAAIAFLTAALPFKMDREWVNVTWLIEVPLLIYLGLYSKSRLYRIAAGILSLGMFIKMLFLLEGSKLNMLVCGREIPAHIFTIIVGIICFYIVKFLYKRKQTEVKDNAEIYLANFYVFTGTFLTLMLTAMEMPEKFISLALAIEAFALFITGFLLKDKYFRYSALFMILAAVFRIVFIDLAKLDIIYRILSFTVLGLILLAVSYFYTKINIKNKDVP